MIPNRELTLTLQRKVRRFAPNSRVVIQEESFSVRMAHIEFFYARPENFRGDTVSLDGDEHKHLTRVLRHQVGDRVTVVDGAGTAAIECEILAIERTETRLRFSRLVRQVGEPRLHLTLAQAVPKGARFDWLVEKATEIGVSVIIPLITETSEIDPGQGKVERWRRLSLSAMKQCCRSVWPQVGEPMLFEDLLPEVNQYEVCWIAHEGGREFGKEDETQRSINKALVMIGPEGGFSQREIEMASAAGCRILSLGPRRLRSDTAGLVAATKILSLCGELS